MNSPSYDNHFVLFSDGRIFNLLDVLVYDESIEKTVKNLTEQHGEVIKATSTPFKIFEEIVGVGKNGKFMPIGPTNWPNLFMIRGDFYYYLAYINWKGERKLVANSSTGVFWSFNIIDA